YSARNPPPRAARRHTAYLFTLHSQLGYITEKVVGNGHLFCFIKAINWLKTVKLLLSHPDNYHR
ncbi:MAG: hypothetical protein Q8T04_18665, partial [Bacteroidota bacterium]|nr:hypothetical protein [Bacteroidota bacterium]